MARREADLTPADEARYVLALTALLFVGLALFAGLVLALKYAADAVVMGL